MVRIKLTPNEMMMAATIGVCRHIGALKAGRADAHGMDPGNGWKHHIEGACGEIAVAKALKLFWPGTVNTFKDGGDVGKLQIKTRSKSHYDLIIREDDSDDAYFVLATGECPNYEVIGYIRARDGKRPEWIQTYGDRPAAWFVPQSALIPIGEMDLIATDDEDMSALISAEHAARYGSAARRTSVDTQQQTDRVQQSHAPVQRP